VAVEFIQVPGHSESASAAGYGLVARSNDLVFLSGMTGSGPDFESQCVEVYEKMKACLAAAGGTLSDVISLRTFLSDRSQRPKNAEIRRRYFPGPQLPCSTLVVVEMGSPELLLEIEAVAHVPPRRG
jgi:enamine deaminase RidA (YjgF/YER057c/UK114 family)